jgi:hypothetical protein
MSPEWTRKTIKSYISRESLFNFCADRQEVEKLVGGAGPKASRQPYVPAS